MLAGLLEQTMASSYVHTYVVAAVCYRLPFLPYSISFVARAYLPCLNAMCRWLFHLTPLIRPQGHHLLSSASCPYFSVVCGNSLDRIERYFAAIATTMRWVSFLGLFPASFFYEREAGMSRRLDLFFRWNKLVDIRSQELIKVSKHRPCWAEGGQSLLAGCLQEKPRKPISTVWSPKDELIKSYKVIWRIKTVCSSRGRVVTRGFFLWLWV